jgi:hypothetical protein
VTGAKVKNHSLSSKDFHAGELPAGPPGRTGERGPKGEPGPAGATSVLVRWGSAILLGNETAATLGASCQTGEAVTGGGWQFENEMPANPSYEVLANRPIASETEAVPPPTGSPATGWMVKIRNRTGSPFGIRPYVLCASP